MLDDTTIVSYNLYFADLSISHGMSAMKNGDINSTTVNQDQFRKHHAYWLNTCLAVYDWWILYGISDHDKRNLSLTIFILEITIVFRFIHSLFLALFCFYVLFLLLFFFPTFVIVGFVVVIIKWQNKIWGTSSIRK